MKPKSDHQKPKVCARIKKALEELSKAGLDFPANVGSAFSNNGLAFSLVNNSSRKIQISFGDLYAPELDRIERVTGVKIPEPAAESN